MQLGFAVPQTGAWATPANQVTVARRAEELGWASLWTLQRLLYPAEPDSPRWQPSYRSVADPVVTLAYLAGHTGRVRLGTAVLNMPWFSPVLLAKQTASLDQVSGGRLDVGLGLGWAAQEYAAAGAPMDRRGARAEEFLACLRSCWTDDVVDFRGEFHRVEAAVVEPKPVQRPHPPLLLGGTVEAALRRAGRVADGWISSSGHDLTDIGTSVRVVAAAAEEAGRDPGSLRYVCRGVLRLREAGRPDRRPLSGSLEEVRADLDTLATQGVTETFLDLNLDRQVGTTDADPVAAMDRAAELLEALAPGPAGGPAAQGGA
jgi:probable F420-dependent oxidoreductase